MSYTYNITLNDTSPLLLFSDAWQECFTQSGCVPTEAGAYGYGQGYHATNGSSSSNMTLRFRGNAFYLYGSSNSTDALSLLLDNSPFNSAPDTVTDSSADSPSLLAFADSLNEGDHTLTLKATGPLNVTSAIVTAQSLTSASNTTIPYWNTSITYTGEWVTPTVQGLANGTARTNQVGATASLNFTGIAVIAYGSLNNGHGPYNVTLDDQVYSYNGGSVQWLIPQSVIFYQADLEAGYEHTLTFIDRPDGNSSTFTLNAITVVREDGEVATGTLTSSFTSATSSSTASSTSTVTAASSYRSSSNAGAIAGGTVGGVCFLALVAGLLAFFLRRRNRKQESAMPFVSTPEEEEKDLGATASIGRAAGSGKGRADRAAFRSTPIIDVRRTDDAASTRSAAGRARSASASRSVGNLTSQGAAHSLPPPPALQAPVTDASQPSHPSNPDTGSPISENISPNSDTVDRLLELLVARIDARQTDGAVSEGGSQPPVYEDRRRSEDRD